MTNTRRERVPCGLTPWAALRSLAEGFASGPRSPSQSRLLQPAALLPARRGGASSPEERPEEPDPASGHAPSWSEPSVSLTAVRSARGGGGRPPANGARRSPGVLVLAERRAPWRPHTSRRFGLRSRRMGSRLMAMPRATLALLPARRPTMTTCSVCEPAGAPSVVARETNPDLTPVCASSTEASTRPAHAGIVC